MTSTIKIFYNLFWKNKSCQNLFLLSKEELLENVSFEFEGNKQNYPLPRIIISNALESNEDVLNTVVNRSESQNILLKDLIDNRFNSLIKPLEIIFEKKLKIPFENVAKYIDKKGIIGLIRIITKLADEENREKNVINLLQEFKFITPNIIDFQTLTESLKRDFIPKKDGELFNEKNINTFFEGVKMVKDVYITIYSKKLHNTNQILVNSLSSEDNFESRLTLFHHLYENEIITSSNEDALIECTNCKKNTFSGVLRLSIDPNKLKNLKCPVCNSELIYFVPYELHKDIFEIVKERDGLLLNAFCNYLQSKNIAYQTNVNFLDNIEVDCVFSDPKTFYIVEAKMYKINTPINRLETKIKKDLKDLLKVVKRLEILDDFKDKNINPILLVNVIDSNMLERIELEFKGNNLDLLTQNARILNIDLVQR